MDVLHAALKAEPHHIKAEPHHLKAEPHNIKSEKPPKSKKDKSQLATMAPEDHPHTLMELGREALAMHHQTLHDAHIVDHRDEYIKQHDHRFHALQREKLHEDMPHYTDYHEQLHSAYDDPYILAEYGLTHQMQHPV